MTSSSISLNDLLGPLKKVSGLSALKRQAAKAALTESEEVERNEETYQKISTNRKIRGNSSKREQSYSLKSKVVQAPLSNAAMGRINRKVAYDETSSDISKWAPIIQKNRQAEHLKFPLNSNSSNCITTTSLTTKFQPTSDLENRIESVLKKNDAINIKEEDNSLSSLPTNILSIEEVRKRQIDLQKMRAFLHYQEQKLKKAAKIKSKSYHRIKKKEKLKKLEQALMSEDPSLVKDQLEKHEYNRARERMTLRHKGASKIASQLLRTDDSDSKLVHESMLDELKRIEQLKRKINGAEEGIESDEDEEVDSKINKAFDDSDEDTYEDISKFKRSSLFEMKFMKKKREKNKSSDIDDESEKDDDDLTPLQVNSELSIVGKRSFVAVERPHIDPNYIPAFNNDISVIPTKPKNRSKVKESSPLLLSKVNDVNDFDPQYDEESGFQTEAGINPWLNAKQPSSKFLLNDQRHVDSLTSVVRKIKKVKSAKSKNHQNASVSIEDENEEFDLSLKDSVSLQFQKDLVEKAFANDEVIAEFEDRKLLLVKEEAPKDIDITLPGWGSWGGPGTENEYKKRIIIKAKPGEGIAPEKRKDAHLKHVIINEKKLKPIEKYQIEKVPYPFDSKSHFEASQRMPIGKEWNATSTYQRNITPRVEVRSGTVINPIRLSKK